MTFDHGVDVTGPVGGSSHIEVLDAALALIAAFARHDTERYFSAFREDATFVFHNHHRRLESLGQYRALWRRWERDNGFTVLDCESSERRIDLYGDVAVFTHDVATTQRSGATVADATVTITAERETIVFARVGDRWLAVHEHLSPR